MINFHDSTRLTQFGKSTFLWSCRVKVLVLATIGFAFQSIAYGQLESNVKPSSQIDWQKYQADVDSIVEHCRAGNDSYLKLQQLCDDIGHRLSGSPSLEEAIVWAQESLRKDGQQNVAAEKVMVRKWVRGEEYAVMTEPRSENFNMLGLGGSVATPKTGIEAPVIVVNSKQEFDNLDNDSVKDKIVLFNHRMPAYSKNEGSGYGEAVQYRTNGASWAAQKGAVAALVRSVTAYSLQSAHTGAMRYQAGIPKIPVAAISVEAATMLRRFQDRGISTKVKLYMEAIDHGETPSANVVGELVGTEKPKEIVVIGGHIDSWDVGQGAQDDGCGCVVAMEALNVLRKLQLQPKRTIRVVLFTNEENGLAGAKSYAARHQNEIHVAAIESDSGGFKPEGLSIDLQDDEKEQIAVVQLGKILGLLEKLGATRATTGYSGADVNPLKPSGTACMGLRVDGRLYFNTHHTKADTVDKVNPKELTDCVATVAAAAYIIADLPIRLGDD